MNKIAQFEKVSLTQFKSATSVANYDDIIMPKRATSGSAGYDFFAPFTFTLQSGECIKIPTGLRVKIADGWFLGVFPRSSLGFKYRLTLNNTVGIIDSDYYFADNEGHIFIKMTNCGDTPLTVDKGCAYAQGIFIPFGITVDDDATDKRTGGFGSTNKN